MWEGGGGQLIRHRAGFPAKAMSSFGTKDGATTVR